MGAINSYPQYRDYFGFSLTEGTPSTGIVYAIYTIGNLVGSFVAGPATDWKGKTTSCYLVLNRPIIWILLFDHNQTTSKKLSIF